MTNKLSILVPAYNEEATIIEVIEQLLELELVHQFEKEIIVINDYSKDNTQNLLVEFLQNQPGSFRLINQEKNQGKGAALHKGIEEATGNFLIPQDADLELSPEDINLLLNKAINENCNVVYGSRFLDGAQNKEGLGLWANLFLTRMSNAFTGLRITDMETCYKLMESSVAKSLNLKEQRFGFEPEVTAKLAKHKGIKLKEVSIRYEVRSYEEGKKIGWKDGVHALWCIFKYALVRS